MLSHRSVNRLFCLAVLLLPPVVAAQPFTLDEKIVPLKLTLRDDPDREGIQWTAARGSVGELAGYLYVEGLSPRRGVEAHVFSMDPEQPLTLSVVKELWDEPGRTCETDDVGMCDVKFRTSGDAGFRINGVKGTEWRLLILASPEIPFEDLMPTPLFEARRADAARYEQGNATIPNDETAALRQPGEEPPGSTNTGPMTWIAIAGVVLLAIIAVLLALLIRRRGTTAAHFILAGLIAATLLALPTGPAGAQSELDAESLDAEVDDLLEEMDEADRDAERERDKAGRKRADDTLKKINTALKLLEDARKYYDTWYGDLSNCATVSNPVGAPRIPSFCEGNSRCTACYAGARTKFNEVRGVFEQLRIIYSCNKRAMDAALKLGDSGTAVHGALGVVWHSKIRPDIVASVKKMQDAYDNKYGQLTGRLHDSMTEMGMCEARFGEPDWYDRFGFMYFEFLSDKYKRSD